MADRLCLLWQWACLLVTAAGWGGWIWLGTGRPPLFRRHTWLWCGLAGFFLKYRNYFERGATSAGARLDYWEAHTD